jgi:hypothetical protein
VKQKSNPSVHTKQQNILTETPSIGSVTVILHVCAQIVSAKNKGVLESPPPNLLQEVSIPEKSSTSELEAD